MTETEIKKFTEMIKAQQKTKSDIRIKSLKKMSFLRKTGVKYVTNVVGYNKYGAIKEGKKLIYSAEVCKKVLAELKTLKPKKEAKKISEAEKVSAWARRLAKLTDITLEKAEKIAQDKIEAKEKEIENLRDRQIVHGFSKRREKMINKIERSNPLRRIIDSDHAVRILWANERHQNSNYDDLLRKAEALGLTGDEKKEYAHENKIYKEGS